VPGMSSHRELMNSRLMQKRSVKSKTSPAHLLQIGFSQNTIRQFDD
jgi:hypothetical protein